MNIRSEGEELKFGFNFYPLKEYSSFGFVFLRKNEDALWCRFSKITKKFFFCWKYNKDIISSQAAYRAATIKKGYE